MSFSAKKTISNALLELLESNSMDSITVKQVCGLAGVSRQTLYNHYYSLMDVVEEVFRTELSKTMRTCDTYKNWVLGFHTTLEYLHSRSAVYMHIYHSSHREELMAVIDQTCVFLVRRAIEQYSEDKDLRASKEDKEFMLRFYRNVFMGIIREYMAGNMHGDIDYIADMCDSLMGSHFSSTLRRIIAKKEEH